MNYVDPSKNAAEKMPKATGTRILVTFGMTTTMTYAANAPSHAGEKGKDNTSSGPKAAEDEKKEPGR